MKQALVEGAVRLEGLNLYEQVRRVVLMLGCVVLLCVVLFDEMCHVGRVAARLGAVPPFLSAV
jgi:hypothetical protein